MQESPETRPDSLRSPLHELHIEAGGKIVPFAGWRMPVQYTSIIEECKTVRSRVGLFDVSHMGEIEITGPDRFVEVDRIMTAKVTGKSNGVVQYALLLNDEGGIIDDILVYIRPGSILLVVNAANKDKDFAWISSRVRGDARVTDRSSEIAQIAVQGPRSRDVIRSVVGNRAAALDYYRSLEGKAAGHGAVISRTGYTGELGWEIYCGWDQSPAIWRALLEAGAEHDVRPIGLGARDSLRMEMAYCLYGNDIDENTSPVEAGLRWLVRAKKDDYIGKEPYLAAKREGPKRRLIGLRLGPREIPRPGYTILHGGEEVGTVTSGGFSPTCGTGIALGYVRADRADGDEDFSIAIRRRRADAEIVRGSFVPSSVKGGGEEMQ